MHYNGYICLGRFKGSRWTFTQNSAQLFYDLNTLSDTFQFGLIDVDFAQHWPTNKTVALHK